MGHCNMEITALQNEFGLTATEAAQAWTELKVFVGSQGLNGSAKFDDLVQGVWASIPTAFPKGTRMANAKTISGKQRVATLKPPQDDYW